MSQIDNLRRASETVNNRGNRIAEGEHLLALGTFEEKATAESGMIFASDLIVVETSNPTAHKPGDRVEVAWFTSAPENWKRDNEWAKFNQFVREFTGQPDMDERIKQCKLMLQPHNPGRGVLVRCVGVLKPSKMIKRGPKAGQMSEPFVELTFSHVPNQTPENIAKIRAFVDSKMPAPVPASAAPSYGHAAQQIPPPAGPPPGYAPVWNGQQWVMPPVQAAGPPPGTPQAPAPAAPYWAPPAQPSQPSWPPAGPPAPQFPPAPSGVPTMPPVQGHAPAPQGALLSQLLGPQK